MELPWVAVLAMLDGERYEDDVPLDCATEPCVAVEVRVAVDPCAAELCPAGEACAADDPPGMSTL